MSETKRDPFASPTLGQRLLSLFVWAMALLWALPLMLFMWPLSYMVHPSHYEFLTRFFSRGLIRILCVSWSATVHPDVKREGTYLFVQNHVNHFDFVISQPALPMFTQGMELASHFRYPIYGWYMKARGTIPVHPGRSDQMDFLRNAMRAERDAGFSLLVFPEAGRTMDGHVARIRVGVLRLARDLGLEIVPVAVAGSYQLMHKGSLLIQPRQVKISLGAPVATAGLSDTEIKQVAISLRQWLEENSVQPT